LQLLRVFFLFLCFVIRNVCCNQKYGDLESLVSAKKDRIIVLWKIRILIGAECCAIYPFNSGVESVSV